MRDGTQQKASFPDYTDLIHAFGQPLRRTLVLHRPGDPKQRFSYPFNRRRPGEIVLIIPRAPRAVLVHTKSFYPPDLFRLPTGGLKRAEPIHDALRRELLEETGYRLKTRQFLFHIEVRMLEANRQRRFHSFGFLVSPARSNPRPQDRKERITGFEDLPVEKLKSVGHRLRRLPSPWTLWGKFRALPHLLAFQALDEREARGEEIWT